MFVTIGKARGNKGGGDSGVGDTVVNQLLSKMDGVNSLNNILVIGMTNRKDLIDPALLRPGRLEVHIEISLPDEKGRVQILNIHTKTMKENGRLGKDVDIYHLAAVTKNFSGAELEGLVKSATSFALYQAVDLSEGHVGIQKEKEKDIKVTAQAFEHALEEVKPSFGVDEDELGAFIGDLYDYGEAFEKVMSMGRGFIDQVKNTQRQRLVPILFSGPVGSGKCWAAGTTLRLYSGDVQAVETFVGGELLMGDDGRPRVVTPGTVIQGRAVMHRIDPHWEGAEAFTVNGAHILVLAVNAGPRVRKSQFSLEVVWYEVDVSSGLRQRRQRFPTRDLADAACAQRLKGWQPLVWEVSVDDFLARAAPVREACQLFQSRAVSFRSPRPDSLAQHLKGILGGAPSPQQCAWAAWYLGLWLANGVASCDWICQAGTSQGQRSAQHPVAERLEQYAALFEEKVTRVCAHRTSAGHRVYHFKFGSVGPLGEPAVASKARRLLQAYGLLNQQHVPQAWVCDTVDVRRCIVAGMVDGDGCYDRLSDAYDLRVNGRHIADGLRTVAGSLGLRNGRAHPKPRIKLETGDVEYGFHVRLSGDMRDVVQHCALTSNQGPRPGQPGHVGSGEYSRCYGFSITTLPVGDYYGFAVHGGANRRLLLGDFTVTHNVSPTSAQCPHALRGRRCAPRTHPSPAPPRALSL